MEHRNLMSVHSWIFFAAAAKLTSMRWALAKQLAKSEPVVIVQQAISLLRDRAKPELRERAIPLPDTRASWSYQPLYYPERIPVAGRIFRYFNYSIFRREMNSLLPSDTKRIVCYDSPIQHALVGMFGESLSVYLAIDDRTLTVTGLPIRGELEAERKLLGKVDSVVCVSELLATILRSRVPEGRTLPIHVLSNGYDERIFNSETDYDEPEFLRQIPHPRMIVTGHISERIDWDAIIGASRLRPQWSWIFVGPADRGLPEKISDGLGKRGFWHPQIPLPHIPAWIHHSDACAVPYRLNDFTMASSPLKAMEFLAMGFPVLSTRVPSLEPYGQVVQWVEEGDATSYAQALDRCATVEKEPSRCEARRRAVRKDSWEVRVEEFRAMVFDGSS
jgi:glycosyltransferase involved in cell wall biosynthesis